MGSVVAVIILFAVLSSFLGPTGAFLAIAGFVVIVALMPKGAEQLKKEAQEKLDADIERMKAENVILENERLHAERDAIRAAMPLARRDANDERLVLMRDNARKAFPEAKPLFGKRKKTA